MDFSNFQIWGNLLGLFQRSPIFTVWMSPGSFVASKDYEETQIQEDHHVSLITAQSEFVMRCNFYIYITISESSGNFVISSSFT